MDPMILALSFSAAVVIAACVVFFFSRPIDEALGPVIPAEMSAAWRRYVKFGLFVVTFVGGLRLPSLAGLVAMRMPGTPPPGAGQGLLEVLKSISGSLVAASIALLAFFAATLAVDASRRLYEAHRAAAPRPRPPERAPAAADRVPAPAERRPVGTERHASAKERRPPEDGRPAEDAGRFL